MLFRSGQGHTPILVASDLQRPNAVTQLKVVGERAGVPVFAPHPGVTSEFDTPTGDPVQVARDGVAEARAKLHGFREISRRLVEDK